MRSGRYALVTGAAKGIGRAVAETLVRDGFSVVLCYNTSEKEAAALKDTLSGTGNVAIVRADISCPEDVRRLKETCDAFGPVDTIVNNAGISLTKLFQDVTDAEYEAVMRVNAGGAFLVTRAFLPGMISAGFGRIVNIASVWGETGGSMETVYSMSKAALIGMTKALAKEVALCGITVNAVSPGAVDTDMTADLSAADRKATEREIPMGRFGRPQEIADVVSLLVRRESYITGQIIGVNGGWVT